MNEQEKRWVGNAIIGIGLTVITMTLWFWRPAEADMGFGAEVLAAEKIEGSKIATMEVDPTLPADPNNYLIKKEDILSVYDGDTFFIRIPECAESMPFLCKRIGVRIEGMDTPERKGLCEEEEKQAALASIKLEYMLRKARRIELVDVRREKYGRLLGGLMIDGQDVVEEMVLAGLARPYDGKKRQGWCPLPPASADKVSWSM